MNSPMSAHEWKLLTALGVTGMTILLGFALVRAAERRRREERRDQADELAFRFEEFLAGRLPAEALRWAARRAEAGLFWTALEGHPARGHRRAWRRLSAALAGCPHTRAERRALRDDSPWRRELAARRLALVGERSSRRALRRALGHGPEPVTFAAALALANYRDLAALRWVLAHPKALARRTPRAAAALLRAFGPRGLPVLAAALRRGTDDPRLRRAMVEALGLGGWRASATIIEHLLSDPDQEVRVAAARALGRLRADQCATSLMTALRDEAWPVRAIAAWALGRTRADVAVRPLAARLTDPAWWVRRHAAYALAELGEGGRNALREIAYGSPDHYAREMAVEVLGGGFRLYGG